MKHKIFQLRLILAPNIALKRKKILHKKLQKIPPPTGGGFDVGLEKNLSFFADYKGKN